MQRAHQRNIRGNQTDIIRVYVDGAIVEVGIIQHPVVVLACMIVGVNTGASDQETLAAFGSCGSDL